MEPETIAACLDAEDESITSIIETMISKGLIKDERIASWEARQVYREDDSRERVRRHRERTRETQASVTHGNASVTRGNAPEEEADTDTDAETESLKQTAVDEKEERRASQAPPRAPKAHSSSSAKASPIPKAVISPDWQPADNTYALLQRQGIDRAFIESTIDEFILFWTERQEARPGWEATFVNNVKRAWEHRSSTPSPRPPVNATKHDHLIDRNHQALNAWLIPQNVIEGECHEVH
jgi:hypothetical protein